MLSDELSDLQNYVEFYPDTVMKLKENKSISCLALLYYRNPKADTESVLEPEKSHYFLAGSVGHPTKNPGRVFLPFLTLPQETLVGGMTRGRVKIRGIVG